MTKKEELIAYIAASLTQLIPEQIAGTSIILDRPANATFGDYSTNVAMQTVKSLPSDHTAAKNPRAWAQVLTDHLAHNAPSFVEKIEVAGPGFINFFLKTSALLEDEVDLVASPNKKSTIVEYMQPNTNKPLHVGHLRNAILGKALIELLKAGGWTVHAATVNNDRGLHITKSMWAYLLHGTKKAMKGDWHTVLEAWVANPDQWKQPSDMEDERLHKGDFFVGYWYIKGDAHAEDKEVAQAWSEMLQAWENVSDIHHKDVRKLWETMNAWFYEGAGQSYEKLGVSFDEGYISYESAIYEAGKQIIIDATKKDVFTKLPDGAIQAQLEQFNLPNKILLRRDGTGIYMTFDIELTRQRSEKGADLLVWVVGNDQDLYFKQLFAVAELLGYGNKDKYHHFSYGMVRLPEGKMSSRKGTVVYADDVLSLAIEKARNVIDEAGVAKSLSDEEKERIATDVGIGAVKYTMLSYDPHSEIAFDVDKSVTFEGNSGPYLQYAHARARSVLLKASEAPAIDATGYVLQAPEEKLVHTLAYTKEIIARSGTEYAPHLLCTHLIQLAQEFNHMYATCAPIAGHSIRETITKRFADTMQTGLELLGITAPEKM